ncbi:MAG: hypothetical protein ACHQFW_09945 [Chitinophagales bacterium]
MSNHLHPDPKNTQVSTHKKNRSVITFILLLVAAILALMLITGNVFGQTNTFPGSGSVGIGTLSPNASSALEIVSTSQGVLVPRMTKSQRDAILTPATGLLIYQTNSTPGFYFFNGSTWAAVTAKGANTSLSNLAAATSVNQNLTPNANNTIDLGSSSFNWNELYVNNIKFMDGTTQSTAATGGGIETDPQVGTISSDYIPKWNGTALVTGNIQDNNGTIGINIAPSDPFRINVRRGVVSGFETIKYAAIRGENNSGAIVNAAGLLGVNDPSGLYGAFSFPDLSIDDIGVLGVKENDANIGAGIYGWNKGGSSVAYAVKAVSGSTTGSNYGVHAIANGSVSDFNNFGLYGYALNANNNYGLYATALTASGQTGYGIFASAAGGGTNYAGFFSGQVKVQYDGKAIMVDGVDPWIQMISGGTDVGFLRATGEDLRLSTNSSNTNGEIVFAPVGVPAMHINADGNVVVGSLAIDPATGYKLSVDGKIICEELKVQLSGSWPDYVFDQNFNLIPIHDLEDFIHANKHLPGIPSANEISENGISVGDMQSAMMQKIEELFLYIIQLQKEIDALKEIK